MTVSRRRLGGAGNDASCSAGDEIVILLGLGGLLSILALVGAMYAVAKICSVFEILQVAAAEHLFVGNLLESRSVHGREA